MPDAREATHLGVAVELVAAEVEQHSGARPHGGGDAGEVGLVHLEHADPAGPVGRQRRGEAGREIGATAVAHDRFTGPECRDEQAAGGGLSVGAAHQCDLAADRRTLQRERVDHQCDAAADGGAAAAAGELRQAGSGRSGRAGEPEAGRHPLTCARAMTTKTPNAASVHAAAIGKTVRVTRAGAWASARPSTVPTTSSTMLSTPRPIAYCSSSSTPRSLSSLGVAL